MLEVSGIRNPSFRVPVFNLRLIVTNNAVAGRTYDPLKQLFHRLDGFSDLAPTHAFNRIAMRPSLNLATTPPIGTEFVLDWHRLFEALGKMALGNAGDWRAPEQAKDIVLAPENLRFQALVLRF